MGHPGLLELRLQGKRLQELRDRRGLLILLDVNDGRFALPHALDAFDEHVGAHDAEHEDVGHLDHEVRIAHGPQEFHRLDAAEPAEEAAYEKIEPHLEIHVPHFPVCVGARRRGCHDLVRIRCCGDGGRDAEHDQQRREQEPSSHAEQSREQAHGQAETHGNQNIHTG